MTIERIERELPAKDKADKLRSLFPDVFADGRISVPRLRELFDADSVEDAGVEHYGLNWPGRQSARRQATRPPSAALHTAPGLGVNEAATQNLLVVGDNLEVLRVLRKAYAGRVKVIYIDPPYNTGSDFVYNDDFKEPVDAYLEATGQADFAGLLTSNPKSGGRFHSKWLSMMWPRLSLASTLLRDDGLLFVSVDDHEVCHLRLLLNEIFGEENFVSQIIIQSNKRGQTYKDISQTHEYLLVFSKTEQSTINELAKEDDALPFADSKGKYDLWELRNRNPKFGRHNRPNLFFPVYVAPTLKDESGHAKISLQRDETFCVEVLPRNSEGEDGCWRWGRDKIAGEDTQSNCPVVVGKPKTGGWNIYQKSRKSTTKAKSLWTETEVISEQGTIELGALGLAGAFDHPKPLGLIEKVLLLSTEPGDLVLDFFAGSGTTGEAVMRMNQREPAENRRFILVQVPDPIPENSGMQSISDVTRARLTRASKALATQSANELALSSSRTPDIGFRVLNEAKSNIQRWVPYDGTEAGALPGVFRSRDGLVSGWKAEDVLTEVMLVEGYPLDSTRGQSSAFLENVVYVVAHSTIPARLLVCLESEISDATVDKLGAFKDDVFVCLESAITDTIKVRMVDTLNRVRTL